MKHEFLLLALLDNLELLANHCRCVHWSERWQSCYCLLSIFLYHICIVQYYKEEGSLQGTEGKEKSPHPCFLLPFLPPPSHCCCLFLVTTFSLWLLLIFAGQTHWLQSHISVCVVYSYVCVSCKMCLCAQQTLRFLQIWRSGSFLYQASLYIFLDPYLVAKLRNINCKQFVSSSLWFSGIVDLNCFQ